MNDDWRVELDLAEEGARDRLLEDVREYRAAHEVRERLGDRIVVTADGPRMFAYAENEQQAREAEGVLREALARRGVTAEGAIQRWDGEQQRWETPTGEPVPGPNVARETLEADERGVPEWEVRVELPGHRETVELAERLQADGLHLVRRWRYLLLGARTQDEARSLAERVRAEAPAGTKVTPEGNEALAWDKLHPFAFLGGVAN